MQKTPPSLYFFILIILLTQVISYAFAQSTFGSMEDESFSVITYDLATPDTSSKPSPVDQLTSQPAREQTQAENSGSPNKPFQYCLRTNANCPGPK